MYQRKTTIAEGGSGLFETSPGNPNQFEETDGTLNFAGFFTESDLMGEPLESDLASLINSGGRMPVEEPHTKDHIFTPEEMDRMVRSYEEDKIPFILPDKDNLIIKDRFKKIIYSINNTKQYIPKA